MGLGRATPGLRLPRDTARSCGQAVSMAQSNLHLPQICLSSQPSKAAGTNPLLPPTAQGACAFKRLKKRWNVLSIYKVIVNIKESMRGNVSDDVFSGVWEKNPCKATIEGVQPKGK